MAPPRSGWARWGLRLLAWQRRQTALHQPGGWRHACCCGCSRLVRLCLQDSIGNYYDCRLTLTPAVVRAPPVLPLAQRRCRLGGAQLPRLPPADTCSSCPSCMAAPLCFHCLNAVPPSASAAAPLPLLPAACCPSPRRCRRRPCLPAQDPVCTPKGFLFSREAILENLLEQKKVRGGGRGCDAQGGCDS